MFRELVKGVANSQGSRLTVDQAADLLVKLHSSELMALLELAWNFRVNDAGKQSGHPDRRSDIAGLDDAVLMKMLDPTEDPNSDPPAKPFIDWLLTQQTPTPKLRWPHLIYAYMIENTRIYEVFRRVLHELLHGEKLGSANSDTQKWLRNTDELFYGDGSPFAITNLSSHIRSDLAASRRNAYQRMFGMDLNHGTNEGQPYSYVKANAANSEFVKTFEELLHEVWVGIIHPKSVTVAKPTDDPKIASLATKLHDMLMGRRQYGNLSREEFAFVSMMSWFHLTVDSNLPISRDLKVETSGPEQRLFKIAQQVGLPAHALSRSLFDIADPISRILVQIETGRYNSDKVSTVPELYTEGSKYPDGFDAEPGPERDMRTIINHWSIITGRDMKAKKVALN